MRTVSDASDLPAPMKEDPAFNPIYDMLITRDVAQVLAEFYAYKCQLSGRSVQSGNFHVDHVFPRALGGPDNLENYVIAEAAANSSKSARRHSPDKEAAVLAMARAAAPTIFAKLTDLRSDTGGASVNPIVVRAFRLAGLTVGSRVASGAYLRSSEEAAAGVRWWGYWGPAKSVGRTSDFLQFGVKLLGPAVSRWSAALTDVEGIIVRGTDTYCFDIPAQLPYEVDREALEQAVGRLRATFSATP